jgi:hypothetical protein
MKKMILSALLIVSPAAYSGDFTSNVSENCSNNTEENGRDAVNTNDPFRQENADPAATASVLPKNDGQIEETNSESNTNTDKPENQNHKINNLNALKDLLNCLTNQPAVTKVTGFGNTALNTTKNRAGLISVASLAIASALIGAEKDGQANWKIWTSLSCGIFAGLYKTCTVTVNTIVPFAQEQLKVGYKNTKKLALWLRSSLIKRA